MHQSAYIGINTLQRQLDYDGGICKWWYTPKQNVDVWPSINPLTQEFEEEISLIDGAQWYGPVQVSNRQLGFDELMKQSVAGPYYELSIEGQQAGESRANRVNLQNLPHHQYIIIAKLRAGGFYIAIGNPWSGLSFKNNFKTGANGNATASNVFEFTGESISKCIALASFNNDNSTPMQTSNDAEIIEFTNESIVNIAWNGTRKSRFGAFPEIEVWINDGPGNLYKENSNISVDQAYPLTTQFTISLTGPATGWVVIK